MPLDGGWYAQRVYYTRDEDKQTPEAGEFDRVGSDSDTDFPKLHDVGKALVYRKFSYLSPRLPPAHVFLLRFFAVHSEGVVHGDLTTVRTPFSRFHRSYRMLPTGKRSHRRV
jgi:hypothetical protein